MRHTAHRGGGSDLWDHKAVALKVFLSFTGFRTGLFLFSLEINYEFCFFTFEFVVSIVNIVLQ
jgi:hypothetical protein